MVENGLKTENKGPELTHHIDDLARLIFYQDPFSVLFDSIHTYATYSLKDLDIASYADSNIPYRCSQEMNDILKTLENEANKII